MRGRANDGEQIRRVLNVVASDARNFNSEKAFWEAISSAASAPSHAQA